MRILHVTQEYPPHVAGGSRYVADLAEAQAARGHVVQVLTARMAGAADHEPGNPEVFRIAAPFRTADHRMTIPAVMVFAVNAFRHLRQILRNEPPAVVHAHFAVPCGLAAALAVRKSGPKFVLTCPGADVYDPVARLPYHGLWPYRMMMRRLLRRADAATTLSSDMQNRCRQYYGCDRVEVVRLGPRAELVEAVASGVRALPESGPVRVVSVGRLVKRKGHDVLLQAIARCRTAVTLEIVGEGAEHHNLERLIRRLGIEERVTLPARADDADLVAALKRAHIFALATRHEAFGIVYTEAMAAGLPVVTTRCGGQTDIVVEGETGFLVDVDDARALAERIERLCGDAALYGRMSTAALERSKMFSVERMCSAFMEKYQP